MHRQKISIRGNEEDGKCFTRAPEISCLVFVVLIVLRNSWAGDSLKVRRKEVDLVICATVEEFLQPFSSLGLVWSGFVWFPPDQNHKNEFSLETNDICNG